MLGTAEWMAPIRRYAGAGQTWPCGGYSTVIFLNGQLKNSFKGYNQS